MSYLHEFDSKNTLPKEKLTDSEKFSVLYHSLFDYPLNFSELIKWQSKNHPQTRDIDTNYKNGFYFIKGKGNLVYKRKFRERVSKKKIEYAKSVVKVISHIPTIKFIGITGSLAMNNAESDSDIDLLIITKRGNLWSTRLLVYLTLKTMNYGVRKPKEKIQKDRLCLNIWMDESDLNWEARDRNVYTAHEILQIVPMFTRGDTYKKFINCNKWALKYWPNATKNTIYKNKFKCTKLNKLSMIENMFYKLQYAYMKDKITSEIISPTRAIFHPRKLSRQILSRISS